MSIAYRGEQTRKDSAFYDFTLVLGGISEITDELESKLFDAGCDDALLGCQDGKIFLDFTRESESLLKAIVSAIRCVETAGIEGLRVVEVLPPEMATIEFVNSFLELRNRFPRKLGDFDDEFWQLLAKAGMKT